MGEDNIYPPGMGDRPGIEEIEHRPIGLWWKIAATVAGVLLVINSISGNLNTILIRHTQTQNTPIARDTHALIMQFQDCVTPGGKCFDAAQAANAATLANVDIQNRRVSAAAASCSLGVPQDLSKHRRYVLIHHCLNQTLAQ